MKHGLLALGFIGAFALGGISVGLAAQAPAAYKPQPAPTDKAGIYLYKDNEKLWAEEDKGGSYNRRIAEGGKFSINVRVVRPDDAPLTHGGSADVWVVQDGAADSITGGTMANAVKRGDSDDYAGKEIVGGVTTHVSRGDIVFVPKNVPHTFRNMNGFHAYLIRFDTP